MQLATVLDLSATSWAISYMLLSAKWYVTILETAVCGRSEVGYDQVDADRVLLREIKMLQTLLLWSFLRYNGLRR